MMDPDDLHDPPTTVRGFAWSLLAIPTLAAKLGPPAPGLVDDDPGPALRWDAPARPMSLAFTRARTPMPKMGSLHAPLRRAQALHRFANHELQAIEVMAWALLAFPEAPAAFRRGLVLIIAEEQVHLSLYLARMETLGLKFGDEPVNSYFWDKARLWTRLLEYIAAMALTFEAANLDFAQDFEAAFRAVGDEETADIVARVHADEIGHVRFGIVWMDKLSPPGTPPWDAYLANLVPPLHPARARGKRLDVAARRKAGQDEDFIARLDALTPDMVARSFGRPVKGEPHGEGG